MPVEFLSDEQVAAYGRFTGAQLHRETQATMIRSAPPDQVSIGVIEVEEALDLARRQLAGEPAIRGNLLIGQDSTGMNHDRRRGTGRRAQEAGPPGKITLTANWR
jgi:hypothetical protein